MHRSSARSQVAGGGGLAPAWKMLLTTRLLIAASTASAAQVFPWTVTTTDDVSTTTSTEQKASLPPPPPPSCSDWCNQYTCQQDECSSCGSRLGCFDPPHPPSPPPSPSPQPPPPPPPTPPPPPMPCPAAREACWEQPLRCCSTPGWGCFRRIGLQYAQCRAVPEDAPCVNDDKWECPGWRLPSEVPPLPPVSPAPLPQPPLVYPPPSPPPPPPKPSPPLKSPSPPPPMSSSVIPDSYDDADIEAFLYDEGVDAPLDETMDEPVDARPSPQQNTPGPSLFVMLKQAARATGISTDALLLAGVAIATGCLVCPICVCLYCLCRPGGYCRSRSRRKKGRRRIRVNDDDDDAADIEVTSRR